MEDYVAKLGEKSRIIFCKRHTLPLVGRVGSRSETGWGARAADRERGCDRRSFLRSRAPTPAPPHEGEGIGWRFMYIIQIVIAHAVPLVRIDLPLGRLGKAAGGGISGPQA